MTDALARLAGRAIDALRTTGETLALAESCTGGLLAATFVRHAGVSDVFVGGVVAYADEVKIELLGVPADVLAARGAVSEHVAARMAIGVKAAMRSDWSAAVTGIAGPTGGSADKPVGTVWIGVAGPAGVICRRVQLTGDRAVVQDAAVRSVLDVLLAALGER